jgi:hypothetical protein
MTNRYTKMKIKIKKNTYELDLARLERAVELGILTKIPKTAPLTIEDLDDGDIFKFRNACSTVYDSQFYPTLYVCRVTFTEATKYNNYHRIASDTSVPGLAVDLNAMKVVTNVVFSPKTRVAILRRNGIYETTKPV